MEAPGKIVIGTRGSALARIQTVLAAAALRAAAPSIEIEVRIITTTGDVNQAPIPLDENGKGWFTKEIEEALLAREIDIAVHSLKDMPDELPPGLMLAADLPREDARDVLVAKEGMTLATLPKGSKVGTDSARRRVQALAVNPELEVVSVRGNVPTRIEKLDRGEYDALILAAAGLVRLGTTDRIREYLEQDVMTSAPGQGIMAIEARADDAVVLALLQKASDEDAARAAMIERAFSRAVGGGCKSPVGAYAEIEGGIARLVGMIETDHGIVRGERSASVSESDGLGAMLAKELLAQADHA
jgi:hydroxymethylbilane synthase